MDTDYGWSRVEAELLDAKAMHFDGCHKIYLSMDDAQVALSEIYGYDTHAPNLDKLKGWYDQSCDLRFVTAVHTDEVDPNRGFIDLIPQGWEDDDDDDEERY
jgi:hypothetical protein